MCAFLADSPDKPGDDIEVVAAAALSIPSTMRSVAHGAVAEHFTAA